MSDGNGQLDVAFEPLTALAIIAAAALVAGLGVAAGISAGMRAFERRHTPTAA